ncbi:Laminin subunit [Trichinella spiralis]
MAPNNAKLRNAKKKNTKTSTSVSALYKPTADDNTPRPFIHMLQWMLLDSKANENNMELFLKIHEIESKRRESMLLQLAAVEQMKDTFNASTEQTKGVNEQLFAFFDKFTRQVVDLIQRLRISSGDDDATENVDEEFFSKRFGNLKEPENAVKVFMLLVEKIIQLAQENYFLETKQISNEKNNFSADKIVELKKVLQIKEEENRSLNYEQFHLHTLWQDCEIFKLNFTGKTANNEKAHLEPNNQIEQQLKKKQHAEQRILLLMETFERTLGILGENMPKLDKLLEEIGYKTTAIFQIDNDPTSSVEQFCRLVLDVLRHFKMIIHEMKIQKEQINTELLQVEKEYEIMQCYTSVVSLLEEKRCHFVVQEVENMEKRVEELKKCMEILINTEKEMNAQFHNESLERVKDEQKEIMPEEQELKKQYELLNKEMMFWKGQSEWCNADGENNSEKVSNYESVYKRYEKLNGNIREKKREINNLQKSIIEKQEKLLQLDLEFDSANLMQKKQHFKQINNTTLLKNNLEKINSELKRCEEWNKRKQLEWEMLQKNLKILKMEYEKDKAEEEQIDVNTAVLEEKLKSSKSKILDDVFTENLVEVSNRTKLKVNNMHFDMFTSLQTDLRNVCRDTKQIKLNCDQNVQRILKLCQKLNEFRKKNKHLTLVLDNLQSQINNNTK